MAKSSSSDYIIAYLSFNYFIFMFLVYYSAAYNPSTACCFYTYFSRVSEYTSSFFCSISDLVCTFNLSISCQNISFSFKAFLVILSHYDCLSFTISLSFLISASSTSFSLEKLTLKVSFSICRATHSCFRTSLSQVRQSIIFYSSRSSSACSSYLNVYSAGDAGDLFIITGERQRECLIFGD